MKYTTWQETELVGQYIDSRFKVLHETPSKEHTQLQLTELKYLRRLSIEMHSIRMELVIKKMYYPNQSKYTLL